MTNAVVTINGSHALPTVLGQGPARIPTGGKIRAGIKVLTKKAAENPKAKEIYEQGVAAGQSFEQIEKSIAEALPNLKTPLVPKNVPWFTVRAQDFPNPAIARQILDAYGEERGDGVKRLYRFPVVFPSDLWQVVMPHELAAWGANEKRYWSEYSPDGRVRNCKCYALVPRDDTGKRAIRIFGGRKATLRDENGGVCDPEHCREYQQRQCNLSGRFVFFVPGIRSISAFELHTNSFYAMNAAIQKFETIAFLRGGRLSGFLDAKRTPFYLTKKLMDVPHIDDDGRAVRVPQWIIDLEAPVDVTTLLRENDDEETAIVNAQLASQIVQGPIIAADARSDAAAFDNMTTQTLQERSKEAPPSAARAVSTRESTQHASPRAGSKTAAAAQTVDRASAAEPIAGPSLDLVIQAARSYGIEPARYEAYADKLWGSGWKINAGGRRRALEELERYRNDPDGYLDKIESELKVLT